MSLSTPSHPPFCPSSPIPPSRPSIRRIPKRPRKHGHMKMLPLLPRALSHHKPNHNLRKKRLNAPLRKIRPRLKRKTPRLRARPREHVGKRRNSRRRRRPGCHAPVGVGVRRVLGWCCRGGRGRRRVQRQCNRDPRARPPDGRVEDVARNRRFRGSVSHGLRWR
jgi:hypothetical protein